MIEFDSPAPQTTGTTCNPIKSPECWHAERVPRVQLGAVLHRPASLGGRNPGDVFKETR